MCSVKGMKFTLQNSITIYKTPASGETINSRLVEIDLVVIFST